MICYMLFDSSDQIRNDKILQPFALFFVLINENHKQAQNRLSRGVEYEHKYRKENPLVPLAIQIDMGSAGFYS